MPYFGTINYVYSYLSILEESIHLNVEEWTSTDLEKSIQYAEYCEKIYTSIKQKHENTEEMNSLDSNLRKLNILPWSLGNIEICFEFLANSFTHLIRNLLRNPHLPNSLFEQILSYENNEMTSKIILDLCKELTTLQDKRYTMSQTKENTEPDSISDGFMVQHDHRGSDGDVDACGENLQIEEEQGESTNEQQLKTERMAIVLIRYLEFTLQHSCDNELTSKELTAKLNKLMNKDCARILLKLIFAAISQLGTMDNATVKFLINYFIGITEKQFIILATFPIECRHLCDHDKSIAERFIELISQLKRQDNEVILKLIEEFNKSSPSNCIREL